MSMFASLVGHERAGSASVRMDVRITERRFVGLCTEGEVSFGGCFVGKAFGLWLWAGVCSYTLIARRKLLLTQVEE